MDDRLLVENTSGKPDAFLVCVDYADLLALTLPLNRHHFDRVTVVTSFNDSETWDVTVANYCFPYRTNTFYDDGAKFNKWKALQQALAERYRTGWIAVLDADIVFPKVWTLPYNIGCLYTPRRRMMLDISSGMIPPEQKWDEFLLHPNEAEWAGYCQIFHSTDHHLGQQPWYETDWLHAGGADSMFQRKWPATSKFRPDWEVLHLGLSGVNWCGRSTDYVDGSKPEKAADNYLALRKLMKERFQKSGDERFAHERVQKVEKPHA